MSNSRLWPGEGENDGSVPRQFIKKANLSDIVVQKIKTAICNGELKPGDRITFHDELCDRWGISRTTIREALNKLESMGILTNYKGRGTYINDITAQEVIPANHMGSLLDKTAVLQLLEVRKLVEPLIAPFGSEKNQGGAANDAEAVGRAGTGEQWQ